MSRIFSSRGAVLTLLLLLVLGSVSSCGRKNRSAEKLAQDTEEAQKFDSNLTFNNVTLQQPDENGKLWWKVVAKQATYSKDQRNATVVEPKGELFQDGQPIYKIEAQKSEVQQDGKSIVLKGQITATDVKDGSVFKGDEVEWRPKEDVMIVRNNFTGTNKQLLLSAKEGKFITRSRKAEISGNIVATMTEPETKMKTEHLFWDVGQQKVNIDRPVQVERYANKVVTDRGSSDKADVDLKTKVVTFRDNAKVALKTIHLSGNLLTWNINAQTIRADQPITIVNPAQQTTITADSGDMNLAKQVATLTGNVRGEGQKNRSQLSANQVTWFLETQQFEATGNVRYNQENPPFKIAGPKANGKLDDQEVAVSGDDSGRVELQIVPR